ncbi:GRIP and coiled-coil domain-containing protein 2-like isoform X2 [Ceratina calcarata]|nr:GRIP and coiled-coil domain-containing protein 2-like isoform X2 [Ceratina calcarata]
MSCSEVQDEICDLLGKEEIEVKLSNGEVIVNSVKDIINPLAHILSVIQMRIDDKRIRETNRENVSHTVFQIVIEREDLNRFVQKSELNFVHLAGFKEVPPANASKHQTDEFLLALESLILEEPKVESFQRCISNCNNKLMDLLQTPFGVVVMLCTVMPCAAEESHHTLSLASRIKSLKTNPQKNVNSGNSAIEIFAPLSTKLLTESKKIRNGNLVDIGDVESEKRYENLCAVDKRVVLFERQIVPGRKTVYEEPIVSKARRENWLKAAGPSRQHSFQIETYQRLPTIIEMSPEKTFKKRNITQLIDVTNRTFHATFTDFRLDLIPTNNVTNRGPDIKNECIKINEYDVRLNKQDSAVQTSNNSLSPKSMWKKYILDRGKAFAELLEFTDLESQLTARKEENRKNHYYSVYPEELNAPQIICSSLKNNSLIWLEEEKIRLIDELKLKNKELNEIKNDFQSLKSDLEQTICLLTNENAALLHNLSVEKERSTETENNHRKTIDDLQTCILKIIDEKLQLENKVTTLNDQMALNPKTEIFSNEQLITQYQGEIAALKKENTELSKCLAENKGFEDIKESKSLQYELECTSENKVLKLTEKCEYLATKNEKLSMELIAKTEENNALKEENKILSDKISMLDTTNADENDVEQLRSENNVLRSENMALKMKVMMLADESTQFSGNLLVTSDNLDSSRNRNLNNNKSHLTDDAATLNASEKHVSMTESYQELANKVIALQDENNHLSRLNERLSELKSSPCKQCACFKKLNESRKPVALEMKELNHKLDHLQKKFDRERAHIEALKNQELNISFDASFNASFVDTFNLSFVEEKVQQLNNELQTVRERYEEKCDEFTKLCDTKNVDDQKPSKKQASVIETKIDEAQRSINEAKEEIAEMKKKIAKFKAEKVNLLKKIDTLKGVNEELQENVSEKEISLAAATERVKILENELSNMNTELEELSAEKNAMQVERVKLDVKLEYLSAEKETTDNHIDELYRTINELNERASSLTKDFAVSIETIENKYKNDLQLLKRQCDELEQVKTELEERTMLRTKDLVSSVEELQEKISELENEKDMLKNNLKELEIQLNKSKDVECISESEASANQFNEYTTESEIKSNEYVEGNDLTYEVKKRSATEEYVYSREKINETKEELNIVKKYIIDELKSFDCNLNTEDVLSKTVSEMFKILIHTIMLKEKDVVERMLESFEKDKQKLEDEKQQSSDVERRATSWIRELETDNDNLRTNLLEKEFLYKEQKSKVIELDRLLRESNNERNVLKTKVQALELEIGNMQSDLEKQCKVEVRQEDEIEDAHKREKEIHKAFKYKEDELQSRIKDEKEAFEKKVDELVNTIEKYKTMNMELKSNIEGLEANEKQLKNIIEANASDLKMHNQTIDKVSRDFDQLTKASNELTNELKQNKSKIANITKVLKNKCDMLSEYKVKLEIIMPDYEMLQNQAKEKKEAIERYKEEIAKLNMEKNKEIETIKDELNSENIKCTGLARLLSESNNKNIALKEELNNLKDNYEKLRETNMKLERKIRNSMNKLKAEAALEELKDVNKRLQNNLDGASNRISELQESKNKILKEMVNLKAHYESLCQENAEIKKTLSLHRSEKNSVHLSLENSKYDALIQEKNKIALELEGNKLLLTQRDKEIMEFVTQIRELTAKKSEFDNQLKEWSAIIHERDSEILQLKTELNTHQVVNELKEKLVDLKTENKTLDEQVKAFETKSQGDREEMEITKFHNETVLCRLKKECSELQKKLSDYESKLRSQSCSSSLKSINPFENKRRKRSRNEVFNQKRDLESVTIGTDVDDEETCQILRNKIQELEMELVSKNGQIAALERQIQSENFTYQEKCKGLEEEMRASRKKNDELRTEVGKLHRIIMDLSSYDCERCRRWRLNKKEQACQTYDDELEGFNTHNRIIGNQGNLMKLEKEYVLVKDLCRSRKRQIKDLENKVKNLEDAQRNRN